jgi:hypothetical protein
MWSAFNGPAIGHEATPHRPIVNEVFPPCAFNQRSLAGRRGVSLALQLPFLKVSESMGNHDSKIVDAGSVD